MRDTGRRYTGTAQVSSAPVLSLRGVSKHYGTQVAVDRVDLDLNQGEFVTFLGPSGSGKTTTLMMVAGLQAPTSGEILLYGKPLGPLPPYRRNLGMVFQQYALFPHMTVAANIAFPLEMRGVDKAEIRRRVGEVLELVGLPQHERRYPVQLSGGQQQRVALARAIVFQPPLLLMDEPLGALDKKLREGLQVEISRLHRRLGINVLYVTHDQDEALVMSDRIAVFNNGRIEQVGTPEALYERPATRFVADFIGQSSFLPGQVKSVQGTEAMVSTPYGDFPGFNAGGLSAGDEAVLAVRPERIVLGSVESSRNRLRGVVHDVVYLGQSRRVLVRLEDGLEVSLSQSAVDFEKSRCGIGEAVELSWRPGDGNVLGAWANGEEVT